MFNRLIQGIIFFLLGCPFVLTNGILFDTLVAVDANHWLAASDVEIGQKLWGLDGYFVEVSSKRTLLSSCVSGVYLSNDEIVVASPLLHFLCLRGEEVDRFINKRPAKFTWKALADLQPGDWLMARGTPTGLLEVELVEVEAHAVCNMICLTTQPNHMFFITKNLLVVHNFDSYASDLQSVPLIFSSAM